jgi:hypothetical protein
MTLKKRKRGQDEKIDVVSKDESAKCLADDKMAQEETPSVEIGAGQQRHRDGDDAEEKDSETSSSDEESSESSESSDSSEEEEDNLPSEPYAFCGALRKTLIEEYGKAKCSSFIGSVLGYRADREQFRIDRKCDLLKARVRMNIPTFFKFKSIIKGVFGIRSLPPVFAKFSAFVGVDAAVLRQWCTLDTNVFLRKTLSYSKPAAGGADQDGIVGSSSKSSSEPPVARRSKRIKTKAAVVSCGGKPGPTDVVVAEEESIPPKDIGSMDEIKCVVDYLCESTRCSDRLDFFADLLCHIYPEEEPTMETRVPVVITFGPRTGLKGHLLSEGHKSIKGGWLKFELKKEVKRRQKKKSMRAGTSQGGTDVHNNLSNRDSEEPPPKQFTSIFTRERPYNFRLMEPWTMGLGCRVNYQKPQWMETFEKHSEEVPDEWPTTIVHCTSCGDILKRKNQIHVHPQLQVIFCNKCRHVYNEGSFDVDDGVEMYCRWCGDGGQIMGCDHCPKVFCTNCIHRNFGAQTVTDVSNAEDWSCYLCDPSPLEPLQRCASAVLKMLKSAKENSKSSSPSEEWKKFYHPVTKKQLKDGIVCADISNGREARPIACRNSFRKKEPPPVFHYVKESVLGESHIVINDHPDNLVSCCDCEDDCRDPEKCACAKANDGSFAYNRRRQLLRQRDVIYECNSRCKCHKSRCKNRVVGRGIQLPLEVFKTKLCGWGVRTLVDIPAGTFVCEYVGEIISEQEAERRASPEMGDEYLLSLDTVWCLLMAEIESKKKQAAASDEKISAKASPDSTPAASQPQGGPLHRRGPLQQAGAQLWRKMFQKKLGEIAVEDIDVNDDADMLCIDAKWYGGVARFINHCCEPNLEKQSVYVDSHDVRAPRLAFFASTDIKAGSELTWDYGYTKGQVHGKSHPCFCGADKCRRILY